VTSEVLNNCDPDSGKEEAKLPKKMCCS